MSQKPSRFTQGLSRLEAVGGTSPRQKPEQAVSSVVPAVAPAVAADTPGRTGRSTRTGKVNIAGYFDPAVRKQLAMLALEHDTDQVKLMAEALNLLFEKYGRSPIARA